MKKVVIDVETISCADLKKVGARKYASDPSTEISVISWCDLDDGEIKSLVHPRLTSELNDNELVEELYRLVNNSSVKFIAHNAPFEKEIFNYCLTDFFYSFKDNPCGEGDELTFRNIDFIDTLTLSNIYRGPAALVDSAKHFKVDAKKDMLGNALVKKVCKGRDTEPRSLRTKACKIDCSWIDINGNYYKGGFDVYDKIRSYCEQDVITTAELYKKLSSFKMTKILGSFASEVQQGYKMSNAMNERGVVIDTKWLEKLLALREPVFDALDDHCHESWGLNPGQKVALGRKIRETGYKLKGMGKDDILASLRQNSDEFKETKDQLRKYLSLNKSSLLKLDAIERRKLFEAEDGDKFIVKDMFKYCGAYATGRFSSFGIQLQNLSRPADGQTMDSTERMISGVDKGTPDEVAGAIRGLFVPREGNKFFIADLSQIELRRVLDKAGYPEKVKALHEGGDEYSHFASAIYKKKVTKKCPERQDGKAFILGLGYGMGIQKFIDNYEKVKQESITPERAKYFKNIYMQTYPKVPKMWAKYQAKIDRAFQAKKRFRVQLDSGRYLDYGRLRRTKYKDPLTGKVRQNISYFDGKVWSGIYGSKVFQHVVQAECRDILLIKMNALHKAGAQIVMTVHDEVIVEVPRNKSLDKLEKLWENSGKEKIKDLFPGMIIDSDCVLTDRYWSH